MKLSESYRLIKPSIVAISCKYETLPKGIVPVEAPFIVGTGFIVGDGLVATNDHVSKALDSLPKPPWAPADEWPVICYMFLEMGEHDLGLVPLKVIGKFEIASYSPEGAWYGEKIPDVAFVRVEARELPTAKIQHDLAILQEGMDLATAGFPMGRNTLMAPGYLHQLGPTLQQGILGALLPFARTNPHGFIMNVMVQGGASGSPVFLPETGEVVGIINAGLNEPAKTAAKDRYTRPTAVSYGVPAAFLDLALKEARKLPEYGNPSALPTLKHIIDTLPQLERSGPVRFAGNQEISEQGISIFKLK
ncbi:MAG: serine protease [Bacteroidetes bacterium]|nr:serine protease [Bacteroidota bacterium]